MQKILASIIFSLLLACEGLRAQAPNWSVAPANFSHNMSVTAQLYLDNVEQNGGTNLLGAFVGNEVRGVASPTVVAGKAYYFLTVFSNATAGETVRFKAWLASPNLTYEALEEVPYVKNDLLGVYPNGFALHFTPGDDWQISMSAIPPDTALATYPFDPIDLDDYLVSLDNDPVQFTFSPGANLSVTFNNSTHVLQVNGLNPNWTGTDSVLVTATETGTANAFSAARHVRFTVLPNYAPPVFEEFPPQFVQPWLPLPAGDLDTMLTFGGDCLDLAMQLLPPVDDWQLPAWSQPPSNSGSMNMTVSVKYGGYHFSPSAGNMLAAFVNGQLAGVTTPNVSVIGERFYLSLANVDTGEIVLKFYDATRQYLYQKATGIHFVPTGSAGTWGNPILLEFAPIAVTVAANGAWTTSVTDTTWTGGLRGYFFATDCDVPDKRDSAEVIFLVGRCAENIALLPSGGGSLCLAAEGDAYSVQWFHEYEQAASGQTFSINQEGMVYYVGWDADSCNVVQSCPLFIEGNSADFSPPGEAKTAAAFTLPAPPQGGVLPPPPPPVACGGVVVDTIEVGAGNLTWYFDGDGDDYSNGQTTQSCLFPGTGWFLASQLAATSGDCNDANPAIHPGAAELCNNVDDDCSGSAESATNTWTGAGNNILWSNPANWSDATVPLTCQHVVIPAGKSVTVPAGYNAVGKTLTTSLTTNLTVELTAEMLIKN